MISTKPSTARVYADYDSIVKRVEAWVERNNPWIYGCEDEQARARIVQRIVELTSDGYASQRANSTHELRAGDAGVFSVDGIEICADTGRVVISLRQYLAHVGVFVATWVRLLAVLAVALFRRAPPAILPATLLLDSPGGIEVGDAAFVKLCRQGRIEVLSKASRLLIAAEEPASRVDPNRVLYALKPLHRLVNELVPRSLRFALLLRHLRAPLDFVRSQLRCKLAVLASRDLSCTAVIRKLDRAGCIEAFVITTSAFVGQPLWMKGLLAQRSKLHMLWYSQNFIPKMYEGDLQRPNLPSARFMRVDVHWVWTSGFHDYLRELGQRSEIRVVGPILWYLPPDESAHTPDSAGPLRIALFDITPLPDSTTAFGALKNYYSVATISKFVTDSLDSCEEIAACAGRPVLLMLKHKRPPKAGRHAADYLEFLQQLARTRPTLRIIEHDANLFELLGECHLSISVPYTSTVYVAASLRRPAIYYDSFAELVPNYEANEFVHFAAGAQQLRAVMASCLGLSGGTQRRSLG